MSIYENLSPEISKKIEEKNGPSKEVVRRNNNPHDDATAWRTAYIRDIDKIIHSPYYNRYARKTQVFSLRKNDDITRRALHVQYVSRTARTIGRSLSLDQDLIEAIALGHDIGHTPFGHVGEKILDEISFADTGRHFSHNIHSVRVLDEIFPLNLTLDTLSGIASHDGELELKEYKPKPTTFEEFDKQIELCYEDKVNVRKLVPSTLEGCVVRISDIIAYLGKDRQDATRAGIEPDYKETTIGSFNAAIINNLIVNIIENSYGKDYIAMDDEHFEALKIAKSENYELIYNKNKLEDLAAPMMVDVYKKLLNDVEMGNTDSPVFKHHIENVENSHYRKGKDLYRDTNSASQIVIDYVASMTDDYFIDLYSYLFPEKDCSAKLKGYF